MQDVYRAFGSEKYFSMPGCVFNRRHLNESMMNDSKKLKYQKIVNAHGWKKKSSREIKTSVIKLQSSLKNAFGFRYDSLQNLQLLWRFLLEGIDD